MYRVAPSKKYSDRSNSGDVVSRFGNNGDSTSWQTSTFAPQTVSFATDFKHIPADARFMFENIASKIAECRKLADSLCLDIVESHKTNVPIETNRMSMVRMALYLDFLKRRTIAELITGRLGARIDQVHLNQYLT